MATLEVIMGVDSASVVLDRRRDQNCPEWGEITHTLEVRGSSLVLDADYTGGIVC